MSRADADGSRPFCGNPRLDYGTIQRDNGGSPRDGVTLTRGDEEEAQRQGEQAIRYMKQHGCAMVLLPATIITRRILTNVWNSWCIVMVIVIATRVGAQDLGNSEDPDNLPAQILKGMDMSHEAYSLEAFDCDEPEEVATQSIPESCTVETTEDTSADTTARQDYTRVWSSP